jgi:chromosome segregation ATPase
MHRQEDADLNARLRSAENSVDAPRGELDTSRDDVSALRSALEKAQKAATTYQTELIEARMAATNDKRKLVVAHKENERLQSEWNQVDVGLANRILALEEKKQRLGEENKNLQEENKNLREENRELEDELHYYQEMLFTAQLERKSLRETTSTNNMNGNSAYTEQITLPSTPNSRTISYESIPGAYPMTANPHSDELVILEEVAETNPENSESTQQVTTTDQRYLLFLHSDLG